MDFEDFYFKTVLHHLFLETEYTSSKKTIRFSIDIDEIGELVTKLDIDNEEKEHVRTFSGRQQKASLAVRHAADENTKRLQKLGLLV